MNYKFIFFIIIICLLVGSVQGDLPPKLGDVYILNEIGFLPDYLFILIFSIGMLSLIYTITQSNIYTSLLSFGSFMILSFLIPLLSKFYDFLLYDPSYPSDMIYATVIINTIPVPFMWMCYGITLLSFFLFIIMVFYNIMQWLQYNEEPLIGEDFLR